MRSHRLRLIPKFSALPPESESLTIGRIFSRGLIRQIEAQYLTKLSTDSGNWNMYRVMRPPLSETNTETYFVLLLVSICKLKMLSEEVLKAVFPFLEGTDLASCMGVSKQWREIAQDDYLWKCICAKRWPSTCKRPSLPAMTYCKLFQTFHKRQQRRTLLPPRLSFNDLEFYIDIWTEDTLIFSEVVPGPVLEHGIRVPPQGVGDMLKFHLESPEYKMTLPVEPRFSVPLSQSVSVSVLVGRKDSDRVARIINKSNFDYVDRTAYRALAFDYLDFSPCYPFVSGIRAWVSLLFMDCGNEGVIDVFGIEMDFCDAANSKEEVLWLLDMLDWK